MHSVTSPSEFERALEAAVARYDGPAPISTQIRYHFATPGPRSRALAVLAAAQAEGGRIDGAIDAACAIEILHQYWNAHDDIEADVRERSGRATILGRWGLAHGINAGDSLCAIGYLTLLASDVPRPAERTLAMTRVLHEANLAMCEGAASDIAFQATTRVARGEYLTMIGGKTAALFGAACELGALAAGASDARGRAYASVGQAYGIAYQIETDIGSSGAPHAIAIFGSADAALTEAKQLVACADVIARDDKIDRGGEMRKYLASTLGASA